MLLAELERGFGEGEAFVGDVFAVGGLIKSALVHGKAAGVHFFLHGVRFAFPFVSLGFP